MTLRNENSDLIPILPTKDKMQLGKSHYLVLGIILIQFKGPNGVELPSVLGILTQQACDSFSDNNLES